MVLIAFLGPCLHQSVLFCRTHGGGGGGGGTVPAWCPGDGSGVVTSVIVACSVWGSGSILSPAVVLSSRGWCTMVVTSSGWILVAFWFWGLAGAVFSRRSVFWMLTASRGWVSSGAAAAWWFVSLSGFSVTAWAAAGWWICSPGCLRSIWGLW